MKKLILIYLASISLLNAESPKTSPVDENSSNLYSECLKIYSQDICKDIQSKNEEKIKEENLIPNILNNDPEIYYNTPDETISSLEKSTDGGIGLPQPYNYDTDKNGNSGVGSP